MSNLEKDLLILFCKKKRFFNFEKASSNFEYFEAIRENPSNKSKEENLKFIFKKGFKFLKKCFSQIVDESTFSILKRPFTGLQKTSKIEYLFTAFYFQRQAIALKIPLEKFFQPSVQRSYKILNPFQTSKSLNQKFLKRIKKGNLFIQHFGEFVTKQLVSDSRKQIIKKTEELVFKWEELYIEKGPRFLKNQITKQLRQNSKSKLPWSTFEIGFAIDQVMALLG